MGDACTPAEPCMHAGFQGLSAQEVGDCNVDASAISMVPVVDSRLEPEVRESDSSHCPGEPYVREATDSANAEDSAAKVSVRATLSEQEVEDGRRVFRLVDEDGNGEIGRTELAAAC